MDKAFLNGELIVRIAYNFTVQFEGGDQLMMNYDAMAKAMASLIGKPVHSSDGTIIGKVIDYYSPYDKIPHFVLAVQIDNKFKDLVLANDKNLSIGSGG